MLSPLPLTLHTIFGVLPGGPCGPAGPAGPFAPAGPCGPVAPAGPVAPSAPVAPCDPAGPCGAGGPAGPCPGEDASEEGTMLCTSPVLSFRITAGERGALCSKSNMLSSVPAVASADPPPTRPRFQLSSMNCVIEACSVNVPCTKLL